MPKWALAVAATIMCALCTLTTALLAHIFNNLSVKVDRMSDGFFEMKQQVVALQAQVDTQARICRFK